MTKLEYFILASFWAAAVLVLAQFSLELNELLRSKCEGKQKLIFLLNLMPH